MIENPYWFNGRFINYGVSSGFPFHYPSIYTLLRDTIAPTSKYTFALIEPTSLFL